MFGNWDKEINLDWDREITLPFPSHLIPTGVVGYIGKRLRWWNLSSRVLATGAAVRLTRSPSEHRTRGPLVLPLAAQDDGATQIAGAASDTITWVTGAGA
jgi:hypothetical protein